MSRFNNGGGAQDFVTVCELVCDRVGDKGQREFTQIIMERPECRIKPGEYSSNFLSSVICKLNFLPVCKIQLFFSIHDFQFRNIRHLQ